MDAYANAIIFIENRRKKWDQDGNLFSHLMISSYLTVHQIRNYMIEYRIRICDNQS